MTIRFYCECCGQSQQVVIEPVQTDELNTMPWGDIVCAVCHFVIATISADEPGVYVFVKVAEVMPVFDELNPPKQKETQDA